MITIIFRDEDDYNLAIVTTSSIWFDDEEGLCFQDDAGNGYWKCRDYCSRLDAEDIIHQAFINGKIDLSEMHFKFIDEE